jgi:hypothetical protein
MCQMCPIETARSSTQEIMKNIERVAGRSNPLFRTAAILILSKQLEGAGAWYLVAVPARNTVARH